MLGGSSSSKRGEEASRIDDVSDISDMLGEVEPEPMENLGESGGDFGGNVRRRGVL